MNRKKRRNNVKKHQKSLLQYSKDLKILPEDDYCKRTGNNFPEDMIGCFLSRYFFVQVYQEKDKPIRISICRNKLNNTGGWEDNIRWEEIQKIKNEIGYKDKDCVEVYPAQQNVINDANMRHIWVMDELLPFMWDKA